MDRDQTRSHSFDWAWLEVLPTAALILDTDRTVLAVNSACEAEFGYERNDLVGSPADFLVPAYVWPPDPEGISLNLAAETESGAMTPVDVYLGPADPSGPLPASETSGDNSGRSEAPANTYLAMVESVGYETSESTEDDSESTVRSLLSDIGLIVSSSLNIESVCEQFAQAVLRSVPTERIAICATPNATNTYQVIHSVPGSTTTPVRSIDIESEAVLDAYETHTPIVITGEELIDFVSGDLAPLGWHEVTTEAAVIVPLMEGSDRIGLLLLASSRADAFTLDDIDLLAQISVQLAGTIANLQMHADLQRESNERQLLANVAREASSVVEFSAAIGPIAEQLSEQLDMACLEIASIDRGITGGALRLTWLRDDSENTLNERFAYSGSIEESVALEMLPLFASGKELDDLQEHYSSPQLDSEKWGAFISVPMTMLSQVVGTLTVRSESATAYSAEHVDLLTRVADQLAGALQSARMYGRQQKEAEIKRSLAAVSVAVSEDLELQRVFERVSDELAVLVRYDHLTVSSVQNDNEHQWQAFSIGIEYDAPDRDPASEEVTDTWSGRSLGKRPDGPIGDAMEKSGLNSYIEVPLGTQSTGQIGYLTLMNRDENAYTDNDLSLVAQVAAQVTPAIQNAMSHEQALELAESREKQSLLEAKSAELERVNEAKSQFLAMVSHELRTPLTSIAAYTDLLERNRGGNLTDKQVTQLGVVRRNSTHLSKMISDLLDISKIESSELTLTRETFDLSELVIDLVESLSPLAAEKEQEITADITDGIDLTADRQKITQVVSNLVENAVKYSPAGAEINIETSLLEDEGEAEIVVSDNGYGISKEDQERIFDTFFRSRTEENWEVPGTGLGLALVKRIISMHGGSVTLTSEPGEGSAFSILLPILELSGDDSTDENDTDPKSPEELAEATLQARRAAMRKATNSSDENAA